MGYTKIGWQNSPNSSTPLTAENLDKMDSGIKKNSDDIEEANNAFSTFKTGEFETATTDISNLKEDNTINKKDISGLKTDVSGAKSSISDLKNEIDKINPKITELESVTEQLNKDVSKAKEDITTLKQADQNILNKIGTKQNGKVIKASNTIAQDLQALDTAIKNGGAGGGFDSTSIIVKRFTANHPSLTPHQGASVYIPITTPSGYKLLTISTPMATEAVIANVRGFSNTSINLLIVNTYADWTASANKVSIDVIYVKE